MEDISDERALATRLTELSDLELGQIFALRGVSPTVGWRDFFDAAEALLDAASIDRALTRLPRSALVALALPDEAAAAVLLKSTALVDENGTGYDAVLARVRATAAAHPDAFRTPAETPPPAPADEAATAVAAERILRRVGVLADVLLACLHVPFTRTGVGAVSANDRRRLVDAGIVGSAEELEDLLAAAVAAGLVRPVDREWVATQAADAWLHTSSEQRWQHVAEGLRSHLPSALRTDTNGYRPMTQWEGAFPLDPDWPARAAQFQRLAEQWALRTPSGEEPEWASVLREGRPRDLGSLTRHLPTEIDRLYLQADLTAIAPGPLAPSLDLRLRTIAHRESRAQASTYRFSAESLQNGMNDGETAQSVRAFLAEISLTGIPQPLDYLIQSTATRHGRITVQADSVTGRSRIESDDLSLIEAIAVDQTLRPLGLVRDGEALSSRVGRDAVYWALGDARYPVVAVDDAGVPVSLRRGRIAEHDDPSSEQTYARLLATLRASHGTDEETAWLGRELEHAVRARTVVDIVVRLPDGAERTFTLEASALGGGRLRGLDRGSDIERTLPVSHIVSIRPTAEPPLPLPG